MKNYYSILGIDKSAPPDEIKKAYRKLAKQYHPDKNAGDQEAEARFKEISEAYDTLGDSKKRDVYDRGDDAYFDPFGGFGDIFSHVDDIFGDMFGGHRREKKRTTQYDLDVEMVLSFEEAALGCDKHIRYKAKEGCINCSGSGCSPGSAPASCKTCSGKGQVQMRQGFMNVVVRCPTCTGTGSFIKDPCTSCSGLGTIDQHKEIVASIPPGVDDGNIMTYEAEGHEAGRISLARGNLNIHLRILQSDKFQRNNLDIISSHTLSYTDLVLGGMVDTPTIHGKVSVRIPPGTQVGSYLKLNDKGIRNNTGQQGSHLIKVNIHIPDHVSDDMKSILQDLRKQK